MDMSAVIIPKSDQWNADDFIAGPITFTISDVKITPGSEQPVNIVLEGTDKFYRPCKSMSRVLVGAWGADAKAYIGRSLTLYRDPEVKWGGLAVGGIRISHMSDLDGAKTMVLTATKGSRKPFKVLPLAAAPVAERPAASDVDWDGWFASFKTAIAEQKSERSLRGWRAPAGIPDAMLQDARALIDERIAALAPVSSGFDNGLPSDPAPSSQPETLLDAVDQGATLQPGEDPAAARANAIIDEIKAAMAHMDVDSILARESVHIDAMEEGLAAMVRQVADIRKSEITAAREKAREAAE